MKIRVYCDGFRDKLITPEQIGYTDEEWRALSDNEKRTAIEMFASEFVDVGYEERA